MEAEITIIETIEPREEEQDVLQTLRQPLQRVQKLGRNAALAYVGLWGIAYDEAQEMVDRSRRLLDRAESRGEDLTHKAEVRARQTIDRVREQVEEEVEIVQDQIEAGLDEAGVPTEQDIMALSVKIDALARQIDRLAIREREADLQVEAQLGVVTERVDRIVAARLRELEAQIEALNEKLAAVATEQQRAPRQTATAPFIDYDELTAREINERLGALTMAELAAVRRYEAANEKRVTVLREVDRRLEAMPIAGYDELTVDEIEPLLENLTSEQLAFLAEYEAAHENRVTLLRAIEEARQDG
ncbi:MAG: phasin family protein [Candidatus Promineifilaceae bacterium]|nr:phasin family protein [Candidatus Promineifilaceae bacterium]